MRNSHRYAIRRAQRDGFVATLDRSWRRFEDFVRLYTATMQRLGAPSYYFFSDRYFTRLREALGERLSLWIVEKDGVLACASLFTEVCGIVQYHLSASDPAFAKSEPSKLLINAVRLWAQGRSDTDVHLGGGVGAARDSLFFFKSGFSARQHPFRSWRLVIDERMYAELTRRRSPGADVFNHAGFFPAYREAERWVRPG
jgi:lipid II:glycine glycyltransferase (peptidoglycan interpeptide bridge formation enzyme)